jgi:putative transcriptional regulator
MATLLRLKRKELGLSAEEVASAIGVKRRMYYYIESDGKYPSRKVEKRLEQFFGIPAGELLAETEK